MSALHEPSVFLPAGRPDVQIEVIGIPAPQGSKTAFVRGGRAVMVESSAKRLRPWRQQVIGMAREAMESLPRFEGAIRLEAWFFFPRPKAHYGSGRNARLLKTSAPQHMTSAPDASKLARALEDCLNLAGVWGDDSQVVQLVAHKAYDDGRGPRCVARVETVR